ncbi:MAG: DUF3795 domain-containing protein, partial [Candidatus Zixiibacteriota bacterium]
MEFKYDIYCGLYCGACAVLLANEKGEVEKKAKEWRMKPEELKCHGCKTETIATFCVTCELKKCAEDKNVDYCFQCAEYPCARLLEFKNDKHPHHSIVLKNLKFISEKGRDRWLKEQKARWSCPKCGAKFSWYDKTCQNCGEKLYNCEDEE